MPIDYNSNLFNALFRNLENYEHGEGKSGSGQQKERQLRRHERIEKSA